jgi:hypothetical protein
MYREPYSKSQNLKVIFLFFGLILPTAFLAGQQPGFMHSYSHTIQNASPLGGSISLQFSQKDKNGNTWMAGFFNQTCEFDPGPETHLLKSYNTFDGFLAKYNSSGDFIFVRHFTNEGTNGNLPVINALKVDPSGNVYLSGYFSGTANFAASGSEFYLTSTPGNQQDASDLFLAKYGSEGNLIYAFKIGGGGSEKVNDMEIDGSGNVYLTGSFDSTIDFNPDFPGTGMLAVPAGNDNPFIAKFSPEGQFIYARHLTSIHKGKGLIIKISPAKEIYVLGVMAGVTDFDPGQGLYEISKIGYGNNLFIAKFSSGGNLISAFRTAKNNFNGSISDHPIAFDINQANEVIITGEMTGNVDFGTGINYGEQILSGSQNNQATSFISMYSAEGQCIAANKLSSSNIIVTEKVQFLPDGDWILCGYTKGQVDFDPTSGSYAISTPTNQTALFFARYSSQFVPRYARIVQSTNLINCSQIFTGSNGQVEIAGNFSGTADFNPGPAIVNRYAYNYHSFLASYSLENGGYLKLATYGNINTGRLNERVQFLSTDKHSNVFLSGTFHQDLIIGKEPDTTTILNPTFQSNFIAAYNKEGVLKYGFHLRSINEVQVKGVYPDEEGNLHVFGQFSRLFDADPGPDTVIVRPGSNFHDLFMLKYNPDGKIMYVRTMGSASNIELASFSEVGKTGNVHIVGTYAMPFDIDPGPDEKILPASGTNAHTATFVAKFDSAGQLKYAFDFAMYKVVLCKAVLDSAENLVMLVNVADLKVDLDAGPGTFEVSGNVQQLFLVKYNKDGQFMGAKKVAENSPGQNNYYGLTTETKLKIDSAGNIYLGGTFYGTLYLSTSSGLLQLTTDQSNDIFIAKYNPELDLQSGFSIGGAGYETLNDFEITKGNQLYLTGSISGTSDYSLANGVKTINSGFGNDLFLASCTSGGSLLAMESFGNMTDVIPGGIAVRPDGKLILAGSIENYVQVDPQKNRIGLLTGKNAEDVFYAVYKRCASIMTTIQPGNWHDAATWAGGIIPQPGSCVQVTHQVSVFQDVEVSTLFVGPGGNVKVEPGVKIKIIE